MTTLQVNGLTNALQAQQLERTLRALPGAVHVKIDRLTGTAIVVGLGVEGSQVALAVHSAGLEVASKHVPRRRRSLRRWYQRGWLASELVPA